MVLRTMLRFATGMFSMWVSTEEYQGWMYAHSMP